MTMPHPSDIRDDDIPYRCPKCCGQGTDAKFPSLRSLRDHLEHEHSALSQKRFPGGGRNGDLSECFNREAKELERQLKLAKDAEQRHRQLWDKLVEPEYSALENIDREIKQSRMDKERMNEALEDAMDKIERMRRNAELLTEEQKDTVQRLHDRLSLKEGDLELLKAQLRTMAEERSRLEKDKKELSSHDRHKDNLIQLLRNEIAEKEANLSERQRDVDELSSFLKHTADKEAVARKKLEDFIENLMLRADTAEQSASRLQRHLAMSQDAGIDAPLNGSTPVLPDAISRNILPLGPRRQMPAADLSWSTNDILNAEGPHRGNESLSVFDRSQSADDLIAVTSVTSAMPPIAYSAQIASTLNSLPQMSSAPPKSGYHGDKTSDYGSMSSYAVTSPKSQNGTLDRDMGLHNVADDVIREEPIVPLKKEDLPKGYVPQAGGPPQKSTPIPANNLLMSADKLNTYSSEPALSNNHLSRSHGNDLDVDEHGIMWDTDIRMQAHSDEGQGQPRGRPVHRSDSNVSSQRSSDMQAEISRNTERILWQQREMLSNQQSFLAKQQEFLNRGLTDLQKQQQETDSETCTSQSEEAEDEDTMEEDEDEDEEEEASVFERRSESETDNDGSVIEYLPQSSLPPGSHLSPRALHAAGRKHSTDKRNTPKKLRGRFNSPGYKNSDIKKMVTTTLWAVPGVSSQPLNGLTTPNSVPPRNPSIPRHHSPVSRGGAPRKREMQALFCVFMYLDVFSLARAAQVCRTWNRLVQMPSLWRRVSLRNAIVSSKCLNHIAKYCTELSDFSLHGLRGKTRRREEDVAEYLRRTRGSLEEGLEAVMKVAGGSLKKLQVVDCGNLLTDRCLWLASCYSRNIIDVTYISDLDPVGSEVIWSLGAGCRQVSRLIIPPMFPNQNPHKFTNHCAFNIARCWPDLHTLSIGGVDVNSKGLTAIAHFCGKLQRLELDHMCEITEEVAMAMCKAGLKGLRVLHLTFTPVTPKALLHFTSACPYLDDITVRVGISDYYEDTENPQHREEFATIISKLRKLQHRPGFEQKLRLNVDYGAQKLTMPAPLTRR